MAFDGLLMHQLAKEIKTNLPMTIHKIFQISDTEILLDGQSNERKLRLIISIHSQNNRINFTEENYSESKQENEFLILLEKHLRAGVIQSMEQVGVERIYCFQISARAVRFSLYIELLGKDANIILVDEANNIIGAMKESLCKASTRTLSPEAAYHLPFDYSGKQNPFRPTTIHQAESLVTQFHGFSPLLSREIQYRMQQGQSFGEIMDELNRSDKLYLSETEQGIQFHCIPLTHLGRKLSSYPIMEGVDIALYKMQTRQQTDSLLKLVRNELIKRARKLSKLEQAVLEVGHFEQYRTYADLLYTYYHLLPRNVASADLKDFMTGELLHIPLDTKLSAKQNAQKYYEKYRKGKMAHTKLKEQIMLCKMEKDYFFRLESRLELAEGIDVLEIRRELEKLGYFKAKKNQSTKKRQNRKPNIMTFQFYNDIKIFVGKNSIQNDYLTFHYAKKEDLWLHVKSYHGAHVVINTATPDEETLYYGALLAAYYSQIKGSGPVEVNYCQVKTLKKPKGAPMGLVLLGAHKTIYVRPKEEVIQKLLTENLVQKA
ncbi:Rqc2 family fibronectin-binding protein [Paenibacillus lutimineralis]|nr:NFACT family protein [Paenibacillus lutimineralis]